MFWPIVAVGLVGFVAGIRFRAPTLVLISGIATAGTIFIGFVEEASWQSVATSTLAVIFSVNFGYILGVVLRLASGSQSGEAAERHSRAVNG